MPSVVAINNKMIYTQNNWLFGQQQYEVPSSGSGIIAGQNDTELLIITNNHVVEDSEELSVLLITRALRQRSKVLIPIRIWQSLPYSFRIYRKKRENRLRQPIWAILIP
jgi:S1-C subfamily serine protease